MSTKETYCTIPHYICLMHILGPSQATHHTIALFNSVRREDVDSNGTYTLRAVRAYKNGIYITKVYHEVTN